MSRPRASRPVARGGTEGRIDMTRPHQKSLGKMLETLVVLQAAMQLMLAVLVTSIAVHKPVN